jgi:hypothetical protein
MGIHLGAPAPYVRHVRVLPGKACLTCCSWLRLLKARSLLKYRGDSFPRAAHVLGCLFAAKGAVDQTLAEIKHDPDCRSALLQYNHFWWCQKIHRQKL